ncbi:MAG: protein-methionine-sulfoxide reductase catalytic subunit MsrP [Anaerolineae bacterium]
MIPIQPSEITSEHIYLSRRRFLSGMSALAASSLLSACGGAEAGPTVPAITGPVAAGGTSAPPLPPGSGDRDELGAPLTPWEVVTQYTNFYEFTTSKRGVVRLARDFRTTPWTVEVGGLVAQPRTFGLEDLYQFEQEERIYRLRCVEGWSMVIPWVGFPLARLLKKVGPLSQARYVRFETLYDPEQMPGQKSSFYQWPYVEGLRLDEAMHDLTILATGLYGRPLLPQNGAPLRLVVPWKYGFKSIKSIVRIDLVEEQPVSLWMTAVPEEYGFYANVNPQVPHPRWSQASERRIGEDRRIPTMLFNGYADEVAHLYQPLDRREWYY